MKKLYLLLVIIFVNHVGCTPSAIHEAVLHEDLPVIYTHYCSADRQTLLQQNLLNFCVTHDKPSAAALVAVLNSHFDVQGRCLHSPKDPFMVGVLTYPRLYIAGNVDKFSFLDI